jgi:hypothetical protein
MSSPDHDQEPGVSLLDGTVEESQAGPLKKKKAGSHQVKHALSRTLSEKNLMALTGAPLIASSRQVAILRRAQEKPRRPTAFSSLTRKQRRHSTFTAAKISHLALLPQGRVEARERAQRMVAQADKEGFGHCSNTEACQVECPQDISVLHIARMNWEFKPALFY